MSVVGNDFELIPFSGVLHGVDLGGDEAVKITGAAQDFATVGDGAGQIRDLHLEPGEEGGGMGRDRRLHL